MSSLPDYQNDLIARTRKLLQGARYVSLSKIQQTSLIDPDVKGPSWASRTSFPAPKDESNGLRSLLDNAIETLGDGKGLYTSPQLKPWMLDGPATDQESEKKRLSLQLQSWKSIRAWPRT